MSYLGGYGTGPLVSTLLDELKVYLNITGADSDAELGRFLGAAQGVVNEKITAPLVPAQVTETRATGLTVVLRKAPIISVDSVTVSGRSTPLVVGADVAVDLETGILTVQPTVWGLTRGTTKIVYTYGWNPLPDALRLAVLVVAGHLWETQRGSGALPSPGVDQTPEMVVGTGYAMPNRALELLAPYRRAPRT